MGRQTITRDGVELSVETGTASITKVEHDGVKRNAEVYFRADHLEKPIRGWLDTHDEAMRARLDEARAAGGRCAYRIEVTRSRDVAADLPWAQVPQTSRFRRLVGLALEDDLASLVQDLSLASVGAGPAQSSTAGASVPASRPAAAADAPTPPSAPASAQRPAGPGNCVGCGEPLAGRPVKRMPNGYVHTDTPCLEAPFTDPDPAAGVVRDLDGDSDGKTVLQAGREATAQRAAHRQASTADEVAAAAGMFRCEPCNLAVPLDQRTEHEATTAHQGKARQAEQAAELKARREKQIAASSTFDADAAPVRQPGAVAIPRRRSARQEEARPYERYNSDGSVNMGSYAMQANVAAVNWAQRLVIERVRALAGDTGEQPHVDPKQIRSLARQLLNLADRIQAGVRDDGHFDRMDNSHTRARSALSTALNVYPVPWEADDEVKARWADDVIAWGVLLINMAAELDQ